MKTKLLAMVIAMCMCLGLLAACGGSSDSSSNSSNSGESDSGSGGSSSANASVTLKFNFVKSSTDPEYDLYDEYFQGISEASGGEISYELYPSEALGGTADALEMASAGQAIVQDCDLSYLANYVPDMAVGMSPYLIQSPEQIKQLWKSELGQEWEAALAEKGLHLVDLHYFGTRNLICNQEVTSRDEISKLKIRCAATPMWNEVVRVLGGNATNTAWSETYQALTQGVADGAESPYPLLYSSKLFEPCKYVIETEHLIAMTAIVMSEDVYQSLSEEGKKAIDECGTAFSETAIEFATATEEEYKQKLIDEGVTIVSIDKTEFIEAAQDTPNYFPEWSEGLYERAQDAIE